MIALFFALYPYIIMAFGTTAAAASITFGTCAALCLIFMTDPGEIIGRMFGGALVFCLSCGIAGVFIYWMKAALT